MIPSRPEPDDRLNTDKVFEGGAFVDVAVSRLGPGSGRGVFTYAVPVQFADALEPGLLVLVPVRKRFLPGFVVAVTNDAPAFATRPLHAIPEPRIILPADRRLAAEWLARETACTLYAALAQFLPPGLETRLHEVYRLTPAGANAQNVTPSQGKVLRLLAEHGERSIEQLRSATGTSLAMVLGKLEDLGLVSVDIRVDHHTPGQRLERFVRLLPGAERYDGRSDRQLAIIDELASQKRFRRDDRSDLVSVLDLRKHVEADAATLQAMAGRGLIDLIELPRDEMPAAEPAPAPTLTTGQAAAWSAVEDALSGHDPRPQLLFGVTGSGKTEIYLRGVAWCLREGKSAVVLVPEIGLATQVVRRFIDRFPGQVAVLHSRFTDSQRYETWQRIVAGEYRVVVGPRSALFAPVRNLGLIVLDEEHESTYKQDTEPRYHARALAQFLQEQHGAALVLGSATPSVESMWNAQQGKYGLIELRDRVNPLAGPHRESSLELPAVEVVDRTLELQAG